MNYRVLIAWLSVGLIALLSILLPPLVYTVIWREVFSDSQRLLDSGATMWLMCNYIATGMTIGALLGFLSFRSTSLRSLSRVQDGYTKASHYLGPLACLTGLIVFVLSPTSFPGFFGLAVFGMGTAFMLTYWLKISFTPVRIRS